jgi:acyl carrier protein
MSELQETPNNAVQVGIQNRIRKEFAFYFDIDPEKVTLDARLREDLAIDDLGDVAMIVEENYLEDVPEHDLYWKTVRDLIEYIERMCGDYHAARVEDDE